MFNFLVDQASEFALESLANDLEQSGNNLVAFVGAGVSKQAGLPLWKELMSAMDKEAQRHTQRTPLVRKAVLGTSDLLWQAEFFRQELERRAVYTELLESIFTATLNQGKDVLGRLVRLNFRHFLTTNFDTFLQQALRNEQLAYKELDWTNRQACRNFLLKYLSPQTIRSVIHIHGRADQPDSVILSHRDYVARYVATSEYVEKLSVLFATLRLVFIGFSLEDPDLKFILRQVYSRFGTNDVQNYAILGFPREMDAQTQIERERLERQFGIVSIFYDDANGHAALSEVLRALAPQPAHEAVLEVAKPEPGPVVTGDELWNTDPNKEKFGKSPERDGRRLRVHDHKEEGGGVHSFHLSVEALPGAPPLTGVVTFYLHPTFAWPKVEVPVQDGKATLKTRAYGAFTVGAVSENPEVRLELDLSTVVDVLPTDFRSL